MNTKKDYIRAVGIIREHRRQFADRKSDTIVFEAVLKSFVTFFQNDNPKFNAEKFRAECQK